METLSTLVLRRDASECVRGGQKTFGLPLEVDLEKGVQKGPGNGGGGGREESEGEGWRGGGREKKEKPVTTGGGGARQFTLGLQSQAKLWHLLKLQEEKI